MTEQTFQEYCDRVRKLEKRVKALEQEPCENAVSRANIERIIEELENMPCITPEEMQKCKDIVKKYTPKQEQSDDAISRQAVLECATLITSIPTEDWDIGDWVCLFRDRVSQLPSVRPQEQTGHWIEKDGFDGDVYYDCSECGESWTTIDGTPWDNEWNYCPNCGAKMVEPQESEDKG